MEPSEVVARQPIKRFEDIFAWQLARVLARDVYKLTSEPAIARDFGFVSQIRRAAMSVMNNIAEGYERRSQGEFSHFLAIAKASAAEVRSMAYLGFDIEYFPSATFDQLLIQTSEGSRVIAGFRATVEKNRLSTASGSIRNGRSG